MEGCYGSFKFLRRGKIVSKMGQLEAEVLSRLVIPLLNSLNLTYEDVTVMPTSNDIQYVAHGLLNMQGAVGGDDDAEGDKEKEEEAERERQEAIREAEERRKEKHRKMEEEREKMRQEIRDKYNIKKKEELPPPEQEEPANPLMRKKKTPEELAREAEEAEQDDFTKLKNTIETQVNEIKTQIESKCSLQ